MSKSKCFASLEDLKNCKELQNMGRYEWQEVTLEGKPVIACTTNEQYENIIWGGVYGMLEELLNYYGKGVDQTDLASEIRDYTLKLLEKEGIEFVDVFDTY